MYNDTIRTKYDHSADVRIKFGELQTVMDWCDKNCAGVWWFQDPEWASGSQDAQWRFSFDNERDCLLFVLKWN